MKKRKTRHQKILSEVRKTQNIISDNPHSNFEDGILVDKNIKSKEDELLAVDPKYIKRDLQKTIFLSFLFFSLIIAIFISIQRGIVQF